MIVEKSGRKVAVLLSYEDYEHLMRINDHVWGLAAMEAMQEGSVENGMQVLLELARQKGVDVEPPN